MGQLLLLRFPNTPLGAAVSPKGPTTLRLDDLEARYGAARHDLSTAIALLDAIAAKLDQMSLQHPNCLSRASFDKCRLQLLLQIQQAKECEARLKALPIPET